MYEVGYRTHKVKRIITRVFADVNRARLEGTRFAALRRIGAVTQSLPLQKHGSSRGPSLRRVLLSAPSSLIRPPPTSPRRHRPLRLAPYRPAYGGGVSADRLGSRPFPHAFFRSCRCSKRRGRRRLPLPYASTVVDVFADTQAARPPCSRTLPVITVRDAMTAP